LSSAAKTDRPHHTRLDNAFVQPQDFERSQKIAGDWPVEKLHRKLDEWAVRYCPVIRQFEVRYHWSLEQVEFSTDLLFRRPEDLQSIYGPLTRTAIHTVSRQRGHLPGSQAEPSL